MPLVTLPRAARCVLIGALSACSGGPPAKPPPAAKQPVAIDEPAEEKPRKPARVKPIDTALLAGAHAGADDACRTLAKRAASERGWLKATCEGTAMTLPENAPLSSAVVLLVKDGGAEPRLEDAGAYYLAVRSPAGWFTTREPFAETSSNAQRTYIPLVAPEGADVVERSDTASRVVFRLREVVDSVCRDCQGAEREQRTQIKRRKIVLVCTTVGERGALCTPSIELHEKAQIKLTDDDKLTFTQPDEGEDGAGFVPRGAYAIAF